MAERCRRRSPRVCISVGKGNRQPRFMLTDPSLHKHGKAGVSKFIFVDTPAFLFFMNQPYRPTDDVTSPYDMY